MATARHGLGAAVIGGLIYVISGGPQPGATFSSVNEVLQHEVFVIINSPENTNITKRVLDDFPVILSLWLETIGALDYSMACRVARVVRSSIDIS